ncbi:MAG: protein translocase subunit SecD [Phycisphaerales bacterium]
MRNHARHAFLLLAAVLIAIWAIYPPAAKLRLGKDLAGGTTLTYQVDIRPTDPPDTLSRVIDLLKKRVDPTGLLEISIEAQGNDRVSITMPLPTEKVRELKKKFEASLAALGQANLSPEQFDRILALPEAERRKELEDFAGGDAGRIALLAEAARLYDEAQGSRRAYNEQVPSLERTVEDFNQQITAAQARGEPPEAIAAITKARDAAREAIDLAAFGVAQAERAYELKRDEALSTTISITELRQALSLSDTGRRYKDAAGAWQSLASPRERALNRLKERYPAAGPRIDALVAEYDFYQSQRSTLDDPDDLQRLLRGAGVLSFRISVNPGEAADEATLRSELQAKGPRAVRSPEYRWYRINKEDAWFENRQEQEAMFENPSAFFNSRGYVVEEFDSQYWMLCHDTRGKRLTQAEGAWSLRSARRSVDDIGRPCIAFEMDALGGEKMAQLTEANKGLKMAVILDDEVYTAPVIQSKIGNRGQITGSFGEEEIRYVVRVLSAGSLAAKLTPEPISVSTIAPDLGVDNLKAGLLAGVISFVAISAFMVFYYFLCGGISVVALLMNALIVLAAMALQRAAFSLPAIAGVILTFGMAIDANVLIYERIREELSHGEDLKNAVRLGFARALAAIVDGHMTVLIVCVVLGIVGTQEIKGFAITMSVGAVATLFTQLYATRFIFSLLIDRVGLRSMSMLPLKVPAIQGIFHLHIDWMKYRYVFLSISLLLTALAAGTIISRGSDLLDTEFKGGTKITIMLKQLLGGQAGERMEMTRAEVNQRVIELAEEAGKSTDPEFRSLQTLRDSKIRVVNPGPQGVRSSTFELKTDIQNANLLKTALSSKFADVMDVLQPVAFEGNKLDLREAPAYPIISDQLAEIPGVDQAMKIADFVGGVAIVVDNLQPAPTMAGLEQRVRDIRAKPEYIDAAARGFRWVRLAGTDQAVEKAVLLIRDDNLNYLSDQGSWTASLRNPSWRLLSDALSQTTTTLSVESFSATVAATFRARALVAVLLSSLAIVIYIWVRFASIRYSLAAIATSLHDCLVAVGLIALAEVIYVNFEGVAQALYILPFKVDLNVIASVLTILGYSLNDTIIVMDRIREKRGKLPHASREIINRAINDTISRTLITGGTTMLAAFTLYIFGGEAVRAFAFAFIVGISVGTYSSIAVAAPIVWVRSADPHGDKGRSGGLSAGAGTGAVGGIASLPPGPASPGVNGSSPARSQTST